MPKVKRILLYSALFLLGSALIVWVFLYAKYGGGEAYPDLSTEPILPESAIEVVASYHEPFGNVAVSKDNRIFFTVHPEARAEGPSLFEWADGEALPFPDSSWQEEKFKTLLGVCIDSQNRLWALDHGNHGTSAPSIWGFDLESGEQIYQHIFPRALAPIGSFFNDVQVSKDGRYLIISDASFFGQDPALVIHDIQDKKSVRRLSGHPSVNAEDYLIHHPKGKMTYLGGAVALKLGVDGIVLGPDGKYLYFAAVTHHGLFRIPIASLCNYYLEDSEVADKIEFMAEKPLSDGLSVDSKGTIYMSDIEHSGIAVWNVNQGLKTLVRSEDRIRWADGLSFGADSCIYFTDSALPDVILKSRAGIAKNAPYYLYKLKVDHPGFPGR